MINLHVAGSINMICDDSTILSIPAGIGQDISPVVCTINTNGPTGYIVDATLSNRLQSTLFSNTDEVLQIIGNPNYTTTSLPLNDGSTNAYGLYHTNIPALSSCRTLPTTSFNWGTNGTIIDHTFSPATPLIGDTYKFCVGVYLYSALSEGTYFGDIVFTATSID